MHERTMERFIVSKDWITVVFIVIFTLIVLAKLIFPQRFDDFTKLLVSNRYFDLKRMPNQWDYFSCLLFLAHILSASLFIFLICKHFSLISYKKPALLFFQIAIGYGMFFIIKYFLEKIIGDIFKIEKIINGYVWHKLTFKNFLFLFTLLPLLLFVYGNFISKTAILFLLFGFILFNLLILGDFYRKWQKLILPNWFYFILYLCALEIGPYFILYKVFES